MSLYSWNPDPGREDSWGIFSIFHPPPSTEGWDTSVHGGRWKREDPARWWRTKTERRMDSRALGPGSGILAFGNIRLSDLRSSLCPLLAVRARDDSTEGRLTGG